MVALSLLYSYYRIFPNPVVLLPSFIYYKNLTAGRSVTSSLFIIIVLTKGGDLPSFTYYRIVRWLSNLLSIHLIGKSGLMSFKQMFDFAFALILPQTLDFSNQPRRNGQLLSSAFSFPNLPASLRNSNLQINSSRTLQQPNLPILILSLHNA